MTSPVPPALQGPVVTVIIPCYNHANFLGRAIQSALDQTHPHCEIIVVNDGSSDKSEQVARSFEPDVRVITQTNQGLAGARNTGIRESSGELLFFLDSDDWLNANCISRMLQAIQKLGPDYGLVACRPVYVSEPNNVVLNPIPIYAWEREPCDVTWQDLVRSSREKQFPCTVLARRRAVESTDLFDAAFAKYGAEDRDLWIRIAAKYRIRLIPDRLVNIVFHGSNMSSNPALQLTGMLRCLKRARNSGAISRWHIGFWTRCYAGFHLQASIMHRAAGNSGKALQHVLSSLALHPFPLSKTATGTTHGARLKRVVLCFLDLAKPQNRS